MIDDAEWLLNPCPLLSPPTIEAGLLWWVRQ